MSGTDRRRSGWLTVTAPVAVVLTAVVTGVVVRPGAADPRPARPGDTAATALADVRRRTLTSRAQVRGTLGYAGDYDVVNHLHGTVTSLPAPGQVVRQGEVLYRVDSRPVVLLYGGTPAYRPLAAGSSVSGADVRQLNAALVALGHAAGTGLASRSDRFGQATSLAVRRLQRALGVPQTGALALGEVVFLPAAVRVTSASATLGGPAQPGSTILDATSTTPVVAVDLDAARRSQVKTGDAVTVTLPDLTIAPGKVTFVADVAVAVAPSGGEGGGGAEKPVIRVEVTLADPKAARGLDQAPVLVSITTATARDALAVPVTALVALAGGGYAVEVAEPGGNRRLVAVELGLVDDAEGVVAVTGSGIAAGQRVVVPAG